MTWVDGLVVALVVAIVLFEVRQEAGRGLFDAVATVAAGLLSRPLGAWVTAWQHMQPMAGTDLSPAAQGVCFLGLWIVGLGLSLFLHRQVRWTMDQFDPMCGFVFALLITVAAGHVLTAVAAEQSLLKSGSMPEVMRRSCLAEELRSFRTYNNVLSVFHGYQNGDTR